MAELYEIAPYHVLMAATGTILLLAYWLPSLVFRRPPASSALLMLLGLLAYSLLPGMPEALDPPAAPRIWELIAELVVIVVLFATGLRIDDISGYRLWLPTIRLLAIAMPLTIAAVALLGWGIAGMTVGGAVLLGAALAPTDPVLAGDVQVGPPLEGREHPLRFALTTEAGLNDGLAFPFVYLGLLIAAHGVDPSQWLTEWLWRDVLYRIVVGTAGGAATGWLIGKILFSWSGRTPLAESGPGVLALGGVLFCYGMVELAEGYGFIAVFVAGVICRRTEERHEYHRRLHAFSESVEAALSAILLVLLGSTLPALWPALDWRHSLIGFGLIFAIRPLFGWLSLIGTDLTRRERACVAFFGVRGIGSVYYIAYATGHMEFVNEDQIWALVAFTIFASTVIHGLTARLVVEPIAESDGPALGQRPPTAH